MLKTHFYYIPGLLRFLAYYYLDSYQWSYFVDAKNKLFFNKSEYIIFLFSSG